MTFFDPEFILPGTKEQAEFKLEKECRCSEDLRQAEQYIRELEAIIRGLRDKAITNT